MTIFNDLPLDLLPAIVQDVGQPSSLASLCLVNKTFCHSTQPILYRAISVLGRHFQEKVARHYSNPSCKRS